MRPQKVLLCFLSIPCRFPSLRACCPAVLMGCLHSFHKPCVRQLSFFRGFQVECVLHIPCRMVLRNKEGIKVPEACLHHVSGHLPESKVQPDIFYVFNRLVGEMPFSS